MQQNFDHAPNKGVRHVLGLASTPNSNTLSHQDLYIVQIMRVVSQHNIELHKPENNHLLLLLYPKHNSLRRNATYQNQALEHAQPEKK